MKAVRTTLPLGLLAGKQCRSGWSIRRRIIIWHAEPRFRIVACVQSLGSTREVVGDIWQIVVYAGSCQPQRKGGRTNDTWYVTATTTSAAQAMAGILTHARKPQFTPSLHSYARTSMHDEMASYELFRYVPGPHLDILPSAHEYPGWHRRTAILQPSLHSSLACSIRAAVLWGFETVDRTDEH